MTSYIILGLLVGSQAIQILWLKQDKGHSLRKAEAKIGLLKEVIERVQKGEDVPVESMLGTGNAESEKEWAESKLELQIAYCNSLICCSIEGYGGRRGSVPKQEEEKGTSTSCC
jgi:hypothetical protein